MIQTVAIPTITLTGGAGSGAGTGTTGRPLNGKLISIAVTQGNTPHANTDISIANVNGVASRTLFTLTNYNTTTQAWFNPAMPLVSQANAALVYAAADPVTTNIPLDGYVTVTLAEGGAASTCDVVIVYDDGG